MKKVEIKDRIKEALEKREITQTELADKAKIDKGQLSSYISGKYKPRQNNIDALSSALNVNEAWLMGFDVPMERHNVKASAETTVYKVHCETENESKLILSYRELNNANQSRVRAYTENLLSAQKMEEELATATRYQQPTTIAAHHEGNEYTEDELKEIDQFKKMVENKRK